MALPAKLKNFNVYGNGASWIGLIPEVALTKLAKKVEQYRGGGMLSEIDVEMGLEKMELEIKAGGLVLGAIRAFGDVGVSGTQLRFVGAYQEDVAGGVVAAELVVRGMVTEFDPGSAKVGDNTEHSLKLSLTYLKWTIAARVEIEIDVLNNIFVVNGIDRMAAIRAALQQ
jgi:P2 family phage contractile tail tube protein